MKYEHFAEECLTDEYEGLYDAYGLDDIENSASYSRSNINAQHFTGAFRGINDGCIVVYTHPSKPIKQKYNQSDSLIKRNTWCHSKEIRDDWRLILSLGQEKKGYLLSKTFNQLFEKCKRLSDGESLVYKIAMLKPYQQIIGMGREALPLIFSALAAENWHWYWALEAITRENPVPKSDYGDYSKLRDHWLNWAKSNGYDIQDLC